ncbi:hypothetical protein [Aliikangiella sp. IMCC44359]|uniref:hypothetical protein n=1 Tax=Aliikangiella sp. IMCC44359 TaxID=3459125 RepID=UPI00403A9A9D
MKNFCVFLPQIAQYQIEALNIFPSKKVAVSPLTENWQSLFCDFIGLSDKDLPWTRLRLSQFDIDENVKTACCCDPVLVQLTHRGAYMLGPSPLELSHNDALRIVTQINERLMREGEKLYLVDKYSWLFTSEQEMNLTALPVNELIGKDMFNFPYIGKDATYWQQLATEIQMLIKQMIDYQGLLDTPVETMINVHFSGQINPLQLDEIKFIKNENLVIISDNELIKSFCLNSMLSNKTLSELAECEVDDYALIALDDERDKYSKIIDYWFSKTSSNKLVSSMLICQDAVLSIAPEPDIMNKVVSFFKTHFSMKI